MHLQSIGRVASSTYCPSLTKRESLSDHHAVCAHVRVRRKFVSNWSVYPKLRFSFVLLEATPTFCLLNFQQSVTKLVHSQSSVVGVQYPRKLQASNPASYHALWNTCISIKVFFCKGTNEMMAMLKVFLFRLTAIKNRPLIKSGLRFNCRTYLHVMHEISFYVRNYKHGVGENLQHYTR